MSTVPHFDSDVYRRFRLPGSSRRIVAPNRFSSTLAAWSLSLLLVIPVVLRVVPGPLRIAAYAWATIYTLLGRRQTIVALALLWLLNMFTHAIGPPPGGAAAFRHLTIFSAALSVLVIHAWTPPRSTSPGLLIWTFLMSVVLLLHSMFVSTMPDVSVLKAVSFALTFQTLLTAWSRLSPQERLVTEKQLWGIVFALAVLSTPLVAMAAGYFKNGSGFQGLLEHPQAFGPMMAILVAWLFGTWMTDRRMSLWLVAMIGLALVWAYLSLARSSIVLILVGILAALASRPLTALMNRSVRIPRLLAGRLAVFVVSLIVLLAVAGPKINDGFKKFIAKGRGSETLTDAAWKSRGHLIVAMQDNIAEHPWTGIGFGVASSPEKYAALVRDQYFGIVIMAAVEKGVLPVAIVEELGWPLALLYLPWFLALLLCAVRAGPRYAAVCAAVYALNFSECCFFSPGGGGLIVQTLVAMAATAPPASQDLLGVPERAA